MPCELCLSFATQIRETYKSSGALIEVRELANLMQQRLDDFGIASAVNDLLNLAGHQFRYAQADDETTSRIAITLARAAVAIAQLTDKPPDLPNRPGPMPCD